MLATISSLIEILLQNLFDFAIAKSIKICPELSLTCLKNFSDKNKGVDFSCNCQKYSDKLLGYVAWVSFRAKCSNIIKLSKLI